MKDSASATNCVCGFCFLPRPSGGGNSRSRVSVVGLHQGFGSVTVSISLQPNYLPIDRWFVHGRFSKI